MAVPHFQMACEKDSFMAVGALLMFLEQLRDSVETYRVPVSQASFSWACPTSCWDSLKKPSERSKKRMW